MQPALLFALSSAFVALTSNPVSACLPPPCSDSVLPTAQPGETRVARVPSNAAGPAWFELPLCGVTPTPPPQLLQRLDGDGGATDVPFTLEAWTLGRILRPTLPWREGERYRVARTGPPGITLEPFDVVAAAPLPARIGTLSVSDAHARDVAFPRGWLGGSYCSCGAQAVERRVQLVPSAEFLPWFDFAVFTFEVDGVPNSGVHRVHPTYQPPAGSTHDGRGRLGVVLECASLASPRGSLSECPPWRAAESATVRRTVRLRAEIPGTAVTLESDTVEVTLRCGDVAIVYPDAGVDSGVDGAIDGGAFDAGPDRDAGGAVDWFGVDASESRLVDGDAADARPGTGAGRVGCTCEIVASVGPRSYAWVSAGVAGIAALAGRRRRLRRRRPRRA